MAEILDTFFLVASYLILYIRYYAMQRSHNYK